jgi:signal transduction histidine kinase
MIAESSHNKWIDGLVSRLSQYSPGHLTLIVTFVVVVLSVLNVYLVTWLFNEKYTFFIFSLSTILPLMITPLIVSVLLRSAKYLKYYKEHLNQEIESCREKDLILFEQARFALMGEMLANISHQWKQPLNTINLAIITSKTSTEITPTMERYFDIMEDNVNYLANTIDDFMSFFDKKVYSEIRPLEDIIREVQSIMGVHIKNNKILCNIQRDYTLGEIKIASSISQVILNLINNSKDAFAKGVQDKKIDLKFVINANSVEIICCDNGEGVAPEIKERIFDPYFTTKSKTQGTGIGLYMSRQIVQKVFGGEIEVNPKNRHNPQEMTTCFYIKLPYSANCIKKEEK